MSSTRAPRRPAPAPRECSPPGRDLLHQRDHLGREPFHLLVLWAELEQEEVHTGLLEFPKPLGDLLGRAHEPRLETAIRDGVVLETDPLLELRVREPVLVIRIP